MSHGIEEIDRGVVWGTTWHRLRQYLRQDAPVTLEQAKEVLGYPMVIRASYGIDAFGEAYRIKGTNHVFRTDTETVIAPAVGSQFRLIDQSEFVEWINDALLSEHPSLDIESVGTLYGGQTSFVSVVLDRRHIKGDESETLQRILFTNPIGKGSYSTGLSEVRVVCDNTRRMALNKSESNGSIRYVQHTGSARTELERNIIDLAKINLALKTEREKIDYLSETDVTVAEVDAFLETLFPDCDEDGTEKGKRAVTIAKKKRDSVRNVYESRQFGFLAGYDRSAYALFNALTAYLGGSKGKGDTNVQWDNMFGRKADMKDKALALLVK